MNRKFAALNLKDFISVKHVKDPFNVAWSGEIPIVTIMLNIGHSWSRCNIFSHHIYAERYENGSGLDPGDALLYYHEKYDQVNCLVFDYEAQKMVSLETDKNFKFHALKDQNYFLSALLFNSWLLNLTEIVKIVSMCYRQKVDLK